jgi:aminoglycoside phosphotransferase (APT) family kinase protein
VIDEVRALLSRHLPSFEVRSIARLGEGWENVEDQVNGELVIRRRREADLARRSELTRGEADLLAVVARWSTVPIPELIFAEIVAGVLAYLKLPGLPLSEDPVAEPARLATTLGEFLSRLHRAPVEEMEKLVPRDIDPPMEWRREAERDYREIVEQLPAAPRRLVEDFLGRRPPAQPSAAAFCHNDLGSEHVLVDAEASIITGVIDWSDAAVTDPMYVCTTSG